MVSIMSEDSTVLTFPQITKSQMFERVEFETERNGAHSLQHLTHETECFPPGNERVSLPTILNEQLVFAHT